VDTVALFLNLISITHQTIHYEYFNQLIDLLQSVELIDCVMDILPLKDSEVQTVHLPALLSVLIQGLEVTLTIYSTY
jgi:hypothetical protein